MAACILYMDANEDRLDDDRTMMAGTPRTRAEVQFEQPQRTLIDLIATLVDSIVG